MSARSYYRDASLVASFGRFSVRFHAAEAQDSAQAICGDGLFMSDSGHRDPYVALVEPLRREALELGWPWAAVRRVYLCGDCEELVFGPLPRRRPEELQVPAHLLGACGASI